MSMTDPFLPRGDAADALSDAESTVSDDDVLNDGDLADDVPVVPDEPASEDAAAQGPVTAEQQTPLQPLDPDQTRTG